MLHKKTLVLLATILALVALADPALASCKVKESNSTVNKIQAAPKKRVTNKLLFDVVAKKPSNANADAADDNDDE